LVSTQLTKLYLTATWQLWCCQNLSVN